MNEALKKQLKATALKVRRGAIDAVYAAQSGHPGGALSIADIVTYLYFVELNIDPKNPGKEDRDRFVLSKGHACPSLYAAMALKGFFPWEELQNFRKLGAMLQGHPSMNKIPGIDASAGSLAQGSSFGVGIALAGKATGKDYRVYVALGDGEIQEGQVWRLQCLRAIDI